MSRQQQKPYLQLLGRVKQIGSRSTNPERVQQIINWHADQLQNPDKEVACLHLGITANGRLNKVGLSIEPAQAAAMLLALEEISLVLRDIANPVGFGTAQADIIPITAPKQQ